MRGVAVAVVALTAGSAAGADLKTYHSDAWGLTVTYPADLAATDHFKANYFDRGGWRVTYAADTGVGTPILALSLPDLRASDGGGESVATAELRIGASRDPDAVANCLTYGMNSGNNAEITRRTISGVSFTEVPDNSDSEMMKTIRTDDLRAVHHNTCYAIDFITFTGGTANTPPAYAETELVRLRSVLDMILLKP